MEKSTPLLERQVGWLKEKISSSSLEWQKAFVKSITGRSCLEGNVNIIMRPSWRGVFEFHTCFNSLDLPQLDPNEPEMTEEDFLQALDVVIKGEGYNIA
jgi:hypothetical protein